MRYRLALDAGTASLAIAVYELDAEKRPVAVVYTDVWIFPEPLLPAKKGGVGEPKKAARRGARQARRQIERKARRLRRIAHLLPTVGLDPDAVKPDRGKLIHYRRAKAAASGIPLDDLMRVFELMAKRRGYAGKFRDKKRRQARKARSAPTAAAVDDEETVHGGNSGAGTDKTAEAEKERGKVQAGIERLRAEMARAELEASYRTLGEYLLYRFEKGETLKLKNAGLYAHRDMVVAEFEQIWSVQEKVHPVLQDKKESFRHAIFHQRPLKSPATMVGPCPLEPHHPRAPKAQPVAQEFRIEKQIGDLRWGKRNAEKLAHEQRTALRKLLAQHQEVSVETIYKEFGKRGCADAAGRQLNFDRKKRDAPIGRPLKGDTTRAAFRRLELIEEWDRLAPVNQLRVINLLAEMGSPEVFDAADWHERLAGQRGEPVKVAPEVVAFINRMADLESFGRLSKLGFETGRAAYSVKALRTLLEIMRVGGKDESEARAAGYPEYGQVAELETELPPEGTGNTVVDVALRQIRERVNRAIRALGGPPAQVIVELSRDLPLGVKKRNEIERAIDKNMKARKDAEQEIKNHDGDPTRRNIDRYLLWREQDRFCPYCDRAISLADALNGSETEREHVLPRSLTQKRGGRWQLVLAHRRCNDEKGEKTPYQRWGDPESSDYDWARWGLIEGHSEVLKSKKLYSKARLLVLKDDVSDALDDETIGDWTERQFAESSWVAKLAAQWFQRICPDVSVSRGALTAHLRRIWKLDTVIPEVRFAEGRAVRTEDRSQGGKRVLGEQISSAEFDRFRRFWEGHDNDPGVEKTDRRMEKRIDHRHHLVDALVIGLADRSLYKLMADHYRAENEKAQRGEHVRPSLRAPPPIPDIRAHAVELVRNCQPEHRPDRHPDGQLFDGLAYGIDTASGRLVLRRELSNLGKQAKDAGGKDSVRAALEEIAAPETRKAVLAEYDRRRRVGKSAKEALAEPIIHPVHGKQIVKVRMLREDADTGYRVEWPNRRDPQRKHYKYLVHSGNAYLEVQNGSGDTVSRTVRPLEAVRNRRRPSAGVLRIHKGDTLLDSGDNRRYVVKQIKINR